MRFRKLNWKPAINTLALQVFSTFPYHLFHYNLAQSLTQIRMKKLIITAATKASANLTLNNLMKH